MKKNKMMRLASILVICVLLTTSVIGGTFAKYITQATVSDTARVAKWGVTFAASSDLFKASYTGTGATSGTITVKTTAADTKLVAPGTEGEDLKVSSSGGNPEVSYGMVIQLANDADLKVPTLKYKTDASATEFSTHAPVKFSVYNGDTLIKEDMSSSDLTTLFDGTNTIYTYDVNDGKYYLDGDGDGTIDATEKGNALTTAPEIKIKWKWEFYEGTNDTEKALHDKLDTILGDMANGTDVTDTDSYTLPTGIKAVDKDKSNTAVNLEWTMTATQID